MAEVAGTIKSCFAILLIDRTLIGLWYKKHSQEQKITGGILQKSHRQGKIFVKGKGGFTLKIMTLV